MKKPTPNYAGCPMLWQPLTHLFVGQPAYELLIWKNGAWRRLGLIRLKPKAYR